MENTIAIELQVTEIESDCQAHVNLLNPRHFINPRYRVLL